MFGVDKPDMPECEHSEFEPLSKGTAWMMRCRVISDFFGHTVGWYELNTGKPFWSNEEHEWPDYRKDHEWFSKVYDAMQQYGVFTVDYRGAAQSKVYGDREREMHFYRNTRDNCVMAIYLLIVEGVLPKYREGKVWPRPCEKCGESFKAPRKYCDDCKTT